jgi:2-keto-3-deoxy-L-arabinonate dehydratase
LLQFYSSVAKRFRKSNSLKEVETMLRGIYPVVLTPFDADGNIDERALRHIVQFELESGVAGLGVNGFASEAYKLTDDERRRCVEIVAEEVAGGVPLIIGIACGSTEAAIQQAREFARYHPAALMTLPPNTMRWEAWALVEHYVDLGNAADLPIMVQQSPHIQAYTATSLPAEALAEIAERSPNVQYFKIEGPGSAERIAALIPLLVADHSAVFGGGGGISLLDELNAGASGSIPGVGFNEFFVEAWQAWENGHFAHAEAILQQIQPLVAAVAGPSHEYSIHARKYLMKRAGYIEHATVRRPTVIVSEDTLAKLDAIVDSLDLRISRPLA